MSGLVVCYIMLGRRFAAHASAGESSCTFTSDGFEVLGREFSVLASGRRYGVRFLVLLNCLFLFFARPLPKIETRKRCPRNSAEPVFGVRIAII